MYSFKKPSKQFSYTVAAIFAVFALFQIFAFPEISKRMQLAQVSSYRDGVVPYNIKPAKIPGLFNFTYEFDTALPPPGGGHVYFDLPVIPFNDERASLYLLEQGINPQFTTVRDAWNYPVQPNIFMIERPVPRILNFGFLNKVLAQDADPLVLGQYNCRADASQTGYFRAYFEDVALQNGVGFDHPTLGANRRQEVCGVLVELAQLLMLDQTTTRPDIVFKANTNLPSGALAAASSYFDNLGYFDNGTLHKHIVSRIDPTPGLGHFDAFVLINWSYLWDVDSSLNTTTYDFYTVLQHEILHALGFGGKLPAVVSQTNTPHPRGTFDTFTFKDNTLQDAFFTNATLNVPVGAPSPWFTSNQVVYRGVDNYADVVPDGVRPVYSPSSWVQGSSLSHFDMARAPGQTYIMHPSISTNTQRTIHEHEIEVLCHLGYSVLGECEEQTPWANDDLVGLDNSGETCISPVENDGNINNYIHSINSIVAYPGDGLGNFFTGISDCVGQTNLLQNGRSFVFESVENLVSRIFEYTIRDYTNNNRVSMPASIITEPSCESLSTDPYEYICNGEFEFGVVPYDSQISSCPSTIIGWCPFWGSPDVYARSTNFTAMWAVNFPGMMDGPQETYSGEPNDNYIGGTAGASPFPAETVFNKTRDILPPGDYVLSWWGQYNYFSDPMKIIISNNSFEFDWFTPYSVSSGDLVYTVPVTSTSNPPTVPNWQQYQIIITIPDNGIPYQYVAFDVAGAYRAYLDGVSLRPVNAPPPPVYTASISGFVYQDINNNGGMDIIEALLPGVEIGLYAENNEISPIQTQTTQNLPNQGKYQFTNVPEGTYKIVLQNESLFSNITEPPESEPFANFAHSKTVTVENGQSIENKNFGIILSGTPISGCTNPAFTNYNPDATVDDGSCVKNDIQIDKTINLDNSNLVPGGYVVYEITISNLSDQQLSNLVINDLLSSKLIFGSATASVPGVVYNPGQGLLTVSSISPQSSVTIYLSVKIKAKACGGVSNTASLSSHQSFDEDAINNTSTVSFSLPSCIPIKVPKIPSANEKK